MRRLGRSCGRLYSTHAETLGDGISAGVKLTPANKTRLPGGDVVVTEAHLDTNVHATILDNGTRVISKDNGGSIARLSFLYKDGPVYETLFSAGASQFMKHALNKDSVTSSEFVTKTFLAKAGIQLELPQIVNKSWIAFSVEGFRDTVAQADVCDKFWQSLLYPRFSQSTLKECKRLIAHETEEAKRDTPRQWLLDLVHKTAFKGSPLGHSSYCPSYNMKYFKPDSLFDRWDKHYGFKNIAIVATNVDHHDLLHAVQDSVWVARAHQKEGGVSAIPSTYVGGESYEVQKRSVDYDDQFVEVYETYTAYAFRAPGMDNLTQWAAARIIAAALETAATPILRNSYTKQGVNVFYKAYKQTGLLGMITHGATVAQLRAFRSALQQLCSLSSSDLDAHKAAAKLAVVGAFDTRLGTQTTLIETFTATGFPLDCPAQVHAIAAVEPADVKAVVDAMLEAKPTLVHLGDSPAAPVLADL